MFYINFLKKFILICIKNIKYNPRFNAHVWTNCYSMSLIIFIMHCWYFISRKLVHNEGCKNCIKWHQLAVRWRQFPDMTSKEVLPRILTLKNWKEKIPNVIIFQEIVYIFIFQSFTKYVSKCQNCLRSYLSTKHAFETTL